MTALPVLRIGVAASAVDTGSGMRPVWSSVRGSR